MNINNKWFALFLLLTFMGLLNLGVFVTDDLASGQPVAWTKHIINELTGAWTTFVLLPLLLWFFEKFPIKSSNLISRLPFYILGVIVFGTCHTTIMYIVRTPLHAWAGLGNYGEGYGILGYRMSMEFFKQFVVFWIIYGGFLFFQNIKKSQAQALHTVQLEEQLTKARLQSLKMQLNPHFLFNTLNSISSMMYEDIHAADKMMATLSDMLRTTFRINKEEHSVEEEINLLGQYLNIMKVRFNDQLSTDIELEENIKKAQMPVFLFQPLVENSIKYGIEEKGNINIAISAKEEKGQLMLCVEDDGPGLKGAPKKGIGWGNTLERLEKLFGEKHSLQMTNKDKGGLKVCIKIPLHFETT